MSAFFGYLQRFGDCVRRLTLGGMLGDLLARLFDHSWACTSPPEKLQKVTAVTEFPAGSGKVLSAGEKGTRS